MSHPFAESGQMGFIDPNDLDPTGALAAHLAAQDREYGHYVANQNIYVGNALAYAPGHPVPVSNVVRHGYLANGLVDLVDGKDHPEETAAQARNTDAPVAAESETEPQDQGATGAPVEVTADSSTEAEGI